jgi:hypothetical protein
LSTGSTLLAFFGLTVPATALVVVVPAFVLLNQTLAI